MDPVEYTPAGRCSRARGPAFVPMCYRSQQDLQAQTGNEGYRQALSKISIELRVYVRDLTGCAVPSAAPM